MNTLTIKVPTRINVKFSQLDFSDSVIEVTMKADHLETAYCKFQIREGIENTFRLQGASQTVSSGLAKLLTKYLDKPFDGDEMSAIFNTIQKRVKEYVKKAEWDKEEPQPTPEPTPTPEPIKETPKEDEPKKQWSPKAKPKVGLEATIFDLVIEGVNSAETEGVITETIKKKLDSWGIIPNQTEVVIKYPNKAPKNAGKQHNQFPTILQTISAGVNIALVGPAGSGKTTTVRKVSEALELPFYSKSVSAQTGSHEFFGYQDANGNYVRTLFREAYENGGVYLLDEFDAGNPNVLASLNQATANENCSFADKMVDKHDDFIIVMAGNTFGHGATSEYVGRNKIDAATLDRFAFIYFAYDEDFEYQLASDKSWCKEVQKFRKIVATKKIKTIISPRATFDGSKLLSAGMPKETVKELLIYKGLSQDERSMLTF